MVQAIGRQIDGWRCNWNYPHLRDDLLLGSDAAQTDFYAAVTDATDCGPSKAAILVRSPFGSKTGTYHDSRVLRSLQMRECGSRFKKLN